MKSATIVYLYRFSKVGNPQEFSIGALMDENRPLAELIEDAQQQAKAECQAKMMVFSNLKSIQFSL